MSGSFDHLPSGHRPGKIQATPGMVTQTTALLQFKHLDIMEASITCLESLTRAQLLGSGNWSSHMTTGVLQREFKTHTRGEGWPWHVIQSLCYLRAFGQRDAT